MRHIIVFIVIFILLPALCFAQVDGTFAYLNVGAHIPTGRNAQSDISEAFTGGFLWNGGTLYLGVEGKFSNLRPQREALFELGAPLLVSLGGQFTTENVEVGIIPFVALEDDVHGGVGFIAQYRRSIVGRLHLMLKFSPKIKMIDTDSFTSIDFLAGVGVNLEGLK